MAVVRRQRAPRAADGEACNMSRNSCKARALCLERHARTNKRGGIYMICSCGCGLPFNPATTKWRADHGARHAEGGKETADNLWPILESCDRIKAAKDTSEVAKGKRAGAKHFGVERKSGFRRPPDGMEYDWKRGGYRRAGSDD